MVREARIALLVGLAFIILFGLVIGERSLRLSGRSRPSSPVEVRVPAQPGPEVTAVTLEEARDRPVLAPGVSTRPRGPATGRGTGSARRPASADRAPPVRAGVVRAASSQPAPVAREVVRTCTVRPGDTLIKIARRSWGREHGNKYMRIFRANLDKLSHPGRVGIGQVLRIPPLVPASRAIASAPRGRVRRHYTEVTLEALQEHLGALRAYTVRRGDNLTRIARREMGDAGRRTVRRLYEANRDRITNPNDLPVGVRLRIPT